MQGDECVAVREQGVIEAASDTYGFLINAHTVLERIVGRIYVEDSTDVCVPTAPGHHAQVGDCRRLASLLVDRLERFDARL